MRFHSTDEGGAVLALVGPRGSGKTTALDAAGSVWGQHRALDLNTFDTRNSRGVNLGVLGNLPVLYDELEKQDAGVLREFVAIFTNGRDRARATVDGGIRHEARTWQTIVIGAANRSIVELVAGGNDSEALSSRILELPGHLPEGMTDGEATALRNEMKNNCGYAADQYVRYIVQPEVNTWIRSELTRLTAEVWQRTGLKSPHRFWVRMIGSAWVAARIVQNLKLLHFSPDDLIDWAVNHVSDPRGLVDAARAKTLACSLVTEYINAHLDGIVTVTGPFQRGKPGVFIQPKPRYLAIRHEINPPRFWFAEKPFKLWLDKMGHSPKQIIADLAEAEMVVQQGRLMTLGAGTDIPGGQVSCLEINGQHPALSGLLTLVDNSQGREKTA